MFTKENGFLLCWRLRLCGTGTSCVIPAIPTCLFCIDFIDKQTLLVLHQLFLNLFLFEGSSCCCNTGKRCPAWPTFWISAYRIWCSVRTKLPVYWLYIFHLYSPYPYCINFICYFSFKFVCDVPSLGLEEFTVLFRIHQFDIGTLWKASCPVLGTALLGK